MAPAAISSLGISTLGCCPHWKNPTGADCVARPIAADFRSRSRSDISTNGGTAMNFSSKRHQSNLAPLIFCAAMAAALIATPMTSAKLSPEPAPQSSGEQTSRPRRAGDEQQDDKAIKLSSGLRTALTSVSDAAGNH